MRQSRGNLLGAGHLRDALGVDERDRLHAPRAGGLEPADEFELLVDLKQGLFVLQAVARSDLDDLDMTAHGWSPVWGDPGAAS